MNRKQYCSNCNKYGHNNKNCPDPITSTGIICFQVTDHNNNLKETQLSIKSNDIHNYNYQRLSNIKKIKKHKDNIKFLLVRRKHSLNYINFIRGQYDENDYDELSKIFSLMSNDEINKINSESFDKLWNNLWDKTAKKKIFQKEYNESNNKFEHIKNMNYISRLKKIGSVYNYPEWEFPKGRKNVNETNYDCAIREFEEETGIKKDDYNIFYNLDSIHDNFIGTNGLKYKHIFYLASLKKEGSDIIKSKNEIEEIRWCTWDEALLILRPYHDSKITILNNLFLFIINLLEDNDNSMSIKNA